MSPGYVDFAKVHETYDLCMKIETKMDVVC